MDSVQIILRVRCLIIAICPCYIIRDGALNIQRICFLAVYREHDIGSHLCPRSANLAQLRHVGSFCNAMECRGHVIIEDVSPGLRAARCDERAAVLGESRDRRSLQRYDAQDKVSPGCQSAIWPVTCSCSDCLAASGRSHWSNYRGRYVSALENPPSRAAVM